MKNTLFSVIIYIPFKMTKNNHTHVFEK